MFSFFARRKSPPARTRATPSLPVVPGASTPLGATADPDVALSCPLASCAVGRRATVLDMHCGEAEACRLRALGLCEGASVCVLDAPRHVTLLDVRGSRLALGTALSAAITVLPLQS